MKYSHCLIVLLLFTFSSITGAADRVRTVVWSHKPLALTLPVDQDIIIYLPEGDYALGLPPALTQKVEHYPIENRIHLIARAPFPETMVAAKNVDSEEQFLFKLSSEQVATGYDLRVVDGTKTETQDGPSLESKYHRIDVNKLLVRHASQSLYAPERLIPANPAVRPAPAIKKQIKAYERIEGISGESRCVNTGALIAKPIAAWRSGRTFVTAVRLENISDHTITVDPRGCHLVGDFLTATSQHSQLAPKVATNCSEDGCTSTPTYRNVTTMYFTSSTPFWEAVNEDQ